MRFAAGSVGFGLVCSQPSESLKMNAHVKSYLWFIAFMAVTKIVVKPVANSLNIPLVKDILA